MTTQPRTAAGRALLRNIRDYGSVVGTADQILAIEAEAAALDVERLAYVIWMHSDIALAIGQRDKTGAQKVAETLAAEYQRLSDARLSADENEVDRQILADAAERYKGLDWRKTSQPLASADEEGGT